MGKRYIGNMISNELSAAKILRTEIAATEQAKRMTDTKTMEKPSTHLWSYGTRVRKKRGSSWQGRVVGFYSTSLTPEGYAVESEREPGNVQIYPYAALEMIGKQEPPHD